MKIELQTLINRLELVAQKNKDKFTYKINIEVNRKGIVYLFYCQEKAEGHTFLCGSGVTIDEAVIQAHNGIEDACKWWGYEA